MKNQKGITLIALVVTIIVLLILAGISIAMLTGENGLLTRSKDANATNIEASVDEQVRMGVAALRLKIANSAATNAAYDARKDRSTLASELASDLVATSGKASTDWVVSVATDGNTDTNAYLTIQYKGLDYTNAKNNGSATINYALRINQQTLKLSAVNFNAAVPAANVPAAD